MIGLAPPLGKKNLHATAISSSKHEPFRRDSSHHTPPSTPTPPLVCYFQGRVPEMPHGVTASGAGRRSLSVLLGEDPLLSDAEEGLLTLSKPSRPQ